MKDALGKVLLLPMLLHEEGWEAIPKDVAVWMQSCDAFFVENEKTTRRYFKKIWKEMVIDDYQWFPIHQVEAAQVCICTTFKIRQNDWDCFRSRLCRDCRPRTNLSWGSTKIRRHSKTLYGPLFHTTIING